MPTFGDLVQTLGPSSPRKRPASRVRTLGDFVQSMDPSARSPGIAPPPSPLAAPQRQAPVAAPSMLRPGEFNSPPPPHPGLQSPFQTSVAPAVGTPAPPMSAINQFRQDYRQSQLGGLHDAVTELGNANRYNASVPPSPFNPLAAPISGPGMYGQAVNAGGLMNNAEAQQFQRNVGYMPSTTVGGAFGAPGSQPLVLDGRQVERTPATGAQIDSYLGQNPNGRFFQGAQAGMISTPRGPRAGFLSGGEPPDLSQKPQFDRGAYEVTKSGALTPSSSSQLEKGREAQRIFDSRRGGTEQRQKDYQSRVASERSERSAGVAKRAEAKAEARRARRGLFSNEEQIARANPGAYQIRKAEEAKSKAFADNAAADRGVREKLGMAEVAQREKIAEARVREARINNQLPEEGAKPAPELPKIAAAPNLSNEQKVAVHEKASEGDIKGMKDELTKAGIKGEDKKYAAIAEITGQKPWEVEAQDKGGFFGMLKEGHRTLSEAMAGRLEGVLQLQRPKNLVGPSRRVGPDGQRTVPAGPEWIEGQKKKAYKKASIFS